MVKSKNRKNKYYPLLYSYAHDIYIGALEQEPSLGNYYPLLKGRGQTVVLNLKDKYTVKKGYLVPKSLNKPINILRSFSSIEHVSYLKHPLERYIKVPIFVTYTDPSGLYKLHIDVPRYRETSDENTITIEHERYFPITLWHGDGDKEIKYIYNTIIPSGHINMLANSVRESIGSYYLRTSECKNCKTVRSLKFQVNDRNTTGGEIDILMFDNDMIHLGEVKTALSKEPYIIRSVYKRKIKNHLQLLKLFDAPFSYHVVVYDINNRRVGEHHVKQLEKLAKKLRMQPLQEIVVHHISFNGEPVVHTVKRL